MKKKKENLQEDPANSAPGAGSGHLGGFTLLRGKLKEGQCAECATVHTPDLPHNQQSLFWQYNFREKTGRWPTWADAMAHCTPEMRATWTKHLAELGVVVPNKKESVGLPTATSRKDREDE